jgi:hypothetical protein
MLDLQTFKGLMAVIAEVQEAIQQESIIYDMLIEDYDGVPRNLARIEEALVDTLQKTMGNTDWIEWYVYDAMMGTVPLSAIVDGQEILVEDVDQLYYIIVKEYDDAD